MEEVSGTTPEDFLETHREEDLRSSQSGSQVPWSSKFPPPRALVSYSEEAGGGDPVDGQAPSLLPQGQLGLPGRWAIPSARRSRRKVSFRCICAKWAVRVFFLLLRFRRLAGKPFSPFFTFLRTPSRMDVAPAVSARRIG